MDAVMKFIELDKDPSNVTAFLGYMSSYADDKSQLVDDKVIDYLVNKIKMDAKG